MPLAKLLGAKGSVVGMTNTYLKVLMMFGPFLVLNDTFNCFIRNDGNPKLSMAAMLTGSFSNIILDYVFIFPLDMGIFGAILATGLSACHKPLHTEHIQIPQKEQLPYRQGKARRENLWRHIVHRRAVAYN